MSKFNDITRSTQYSIIHALNTLHDPKRGIQTISENLQQAANALKWNAEGWMKASFILQYANWAAEALADEAQTVISKYTDECVAAWAAGSPEHESNDITIDLEVSAERISRQIASECYRVICRGLDGFSSNPMGVIEAQAHIDAAKTVLEGICGLGMFGLMDSNAVNDIIDGRQRREQERKEAAAKVPVKLIVFKRERCDGGNYMANAVNRDGNVVRSRVFAFNVTRKERAKVEADLYAAELMEEYKLSQLPIEL